MGFIIRSKFWLGLGLVVLMAILLFVFGALPMMRENGEAYSTLQDRAEQLGRYRRKEVKNELWVEQQEELTRKLERQLGQIKEELLARDALLERRFSDPETGDEGPLEYGRFRIVYRQKMRDLRTELSENVVRTLGKPVLVQAKLGNEWRPASALHRIEKKYWVQQAMVEMISRVNADAKVVPVFGGFEFMTKPDRVLAPAHKGDKFRVIPFKLNVAMEFQFLPVFMKEFLAMPLSPELTHLRIGRFTGVGRQGEEEDDERQRPAEPDYGPGFNPEDMMPGAPPMREREEMQDEPEKPKAKLPARMVRVRLRGYIPDYEGPEEQDEENGS